MENYLKKQANKSFCNFLKRIGLPSFFLFACSAPAVNMKCAELRFRLNQQALGNDEKRVFEEELRDCEAQADEAKQQDSATMKKLKKPFSSNEDSL